MSIFTEAWVQVFARERGIPILDGVSLRLRGRTRIASRNIILPGHWCHLVRIGEDLHDRLESSSAVQNNSAEEGRRRLASWADE